MIKGIITFHETDELKNLLRICFSELNAIGNVSNLPEPAIMKAILTRQETAELLSISLPTLHDYTKRGLIKAYRIGNKVRYRLEDIQSSLIQIKSSTNK